MIGPLVDPRPSFDDYYLQIANTVSLRGDCRRSQVGAVMVLKDNRTVFLGYNGTTAGQPGCLLGACPRGLFTYDQRPSTNDYSDCIGIHAEDNLLRTAYEAVGWRRMIGSTVYVTREPCGPCYEKLAFWEVRRAVYPEGDRLIDAQSPE